MMELRAEFEKRFPVPANCGWSIGLGRYRCDLDKVGLQSTIDHIRRWEGYQACAESLRDELSQSELDSEARRGSLEHLLAENETLQRELGASFPLIEVLETELAAERAANARLQELHSGLMKNADNMNDELRAANAKLRAFVIKWRETETDSQDEDFDRELFLLNAMANEALGEAVPVQQPQL